MEVHVCADADEVELFQNGVSMGTKPCTELESFRAVFTIPYRRGTIEAAARRDGREVGRDALQTAGETASLALTAESEGGGLRFVDISAADAKGLPVFGEHRPVTVTVTGGGELLALGAADPRPDRRTLFSGRTCPLFEGRAMAVVRAAPGGGAFTVRASLEGGARGELTVRCPDGGPAAERAIHDPVPGPLDLPLGRLLENAAARDVLGAFLGPVLNGPIPEGMRDMSLKRLLSMSGGTVPPELEKELARALRA